MYGTPATTRLLSDSNHAVNWMVNAYDKVKVGGLDAEIEKISPAVSSSTSFTNTVMARLLSIGLPDSEIAVLERQYGAILKGVAYASQRGEGGLGDLRIDVSVGKEGTLLIYHAPKGTDAQKLTYSLRESGIGENALADSVVYSGDDGVKVCIATKYADHLNAPQTPAEVSGSGLALVKRTFLATGTVPTRDNLRTYLDMHDLKGKARENTIHDILDGFEKWYVAEMDEKIAMGMYPAVAHLGKTTDADGSHMISSEDHGSLEEAWAALQFKSLGEELRNTNMVLNNEGTIHGLEYTSREVRDSGRDKIRETLRGIKASEIGADRNMDLLLDGPTSEPVNAVRAALTEAGVPVRDVIPSAVYSYQDESGKVHRHNPFAQKYSRANN